jgi:hypothetical protein
MFVHGWLAASWPLAALDPARLVASTEWRPPTRTMPAGGAALIPFALYCASGDARTPYQTRLALPLCK